MSLTDDKEPNVQLKIVTGADRTYSEGGNGFENLISPKSTYQQSPLTTSMNRPPMNRRRLSRAPTTSRPGDKKDDSYFQLGTGGMGENFVIGPNMSPAHLLSARSSSQNRTTTRHRRAPSEMEEALEPSSPRGKLSPRPSSRASVLLSEAESGNSHKTLWKEPMIGPDPTNPGFDPGSLYISPRARNRASMYINPGGVSPRTPRSEVTPRTSRAATVGTPRRKKDDKEAETPRTARRKENTKEDGMEPKAASQISPRPKEPVASATPEPPKKRERKGTKTKDTKDNKTASGPEESAKDNSASSASSTKPEKQKKQKKGKTKDDVEVEVIKRKARRSKEKRKRNGYKATKENLTVEEKMMQEVFGRTKEREKGSVFIEDQDTMAAIFGDNQHGMEPGNTARDYHRAGVDDIDAEKRCVVM
eukprot:TRINITY_DN14529_c0_g1_i1.p1 TRINITY_DN14529_c0_g1~~TRINITY_DN14529_c0_g1_i1.p1  ORF type:complete len:419 (+),score=110.18 TRINITY_DN14529_c0_g1_i1:71-1327(+)